MYCIVFIVHDRIFHIQTVVIKQMKKLSTIIYSVLLALLILPMAFWVFLKYDQLYNGGNVWAKWVVKPVCELWQPNSEYSHCKVVKGKNGRYAVNYEYWGSDAYLLLEIDHVDYSFSYIQPITTFEDSCQALGLLKRFMDQNAPKFTPIDK